MKTATCFCAIGLFLTAAFSSSAQTLGNAADLPFSLTLEEVTQDELPGLHSFALGREGDWWVVVGGRVGGLHGFFPVTGFPEDEANVYVRLLNPETGDERKFAVDDLAVPFRDALKSTNPQYAQDGATLYVTGGYGKDNAQGMFVTFPTLTAIDLSVLVAKMLAGANPSSAFKQVEVPSVRVCGGEMEKMGDWFFLVGGHDFSGLYSQNGSATFTQAYTSEIRRFKIQNSGNALTISDFSAQHDEANLHRRDFSLAPVVRPDGLEGLALYGGVFRVGADLPFYNPVYIAADGSHTLDAGYEQLFSQYTCPVLPIFDQTDGAMYSIFFAGLSVHFMDGGQLKKDEKVPFVKDISVLRRRADGSSLEFVLPERFDELLGTNMIFVPDESAPHFENEVLKLRDMSGPTFVGWLFGGIKAEIPNITPSSASKRMFKVFLTPKPVSSAGGILAESIDLQVFPNPTSATGSVFVQVSGAVASLQMADASGRVWASFSQPTAEDLQRLSAQMPALPSGVYFLQISGAAGSKVVKWAKM